MNSNSKQRILDRLRKKRPFTSASVTSTQAATSPPAKDHVSLEGSQENIELLSRNLAASRAEIIATTESEWKSALLRSCQEKDIGTLLFGKQDLTASFAEWRESPPAPTPVLYPSKKQQESQDFRTQLFHDIDAGLSFATAAVAKTGTLILATGPQEPRLMSLVPPVHYICLDASNIYASLDEALADPALTETLPTNLLLISGPSKTADIQQVLAYGAHGPKTLVVLLIQEEAKKAFDSR